MSLKGLWRMEKRNWKIDSSFHSRSALGFPTKKKGIVQKPKNMTVQPQGDLMQLATAVDSRENEKVVDLGSPSPQIHYHFSSSHCRSKLHWSASLLCFVVQFSQTWKCETSFYYWDHTHEGAPLYIHPSNKTESLTLPDLPKMHNELQLEFYFLLKHRAAKADLLLGHVLSCTAHSLSASNSHRSKNKTFVICLTRTRLLAFAPGVADNRLFAFKSWQPSFERHLTEIVHQVQKVLVYS